jgi:hypothetical protein
MSVEDKRNGARNAFTFFFAYLNAVAQEIGMDKAIALETAVDETMGRMHGKKLKEDAGADQLDIKTATRIAMDSIREGFGITSEVLSDDPDQVVVRCGRCPVYEAGQSVGMDAATIEKLCRTGPLRFMDATMGQLNPDLGYELRRFRTAPDGFCEEAVVRK